VSDAGIRSAPAVSGALWWSASNWRNRMVFPLSFAAPANVCDLVGGKTPVDIYGSELMIQASTQWGPQFCLTAGRTPIKHVQTGEPQARNLLGVGSIEAAFVTDRPPAPYPKPTVHAPVAATGFAISYAIDGQDRKPYPNLRLTPRLLAKLLTESYPAISALKSLTIDGKDVSYKELANNPLNLSYDPEFKALNPGIRESQYDVGGPAALLALSSDSDVISALTAYINADPEARQWLDGKPDPWGMVVNPHYKGMKLPVDSWPLNDTFVPTEYYNENSAGNLQCQKDNPVPYLPLVASPMSRLAAIAQAMQYAIENSQLTCVQPGLVTGDPSAGEKLVAQGRQPPGNRFMLGLTSLADPLRYGVQVAALQTKVTSAVASKAFTDATGRSFVAPTDATLRTALGHVKPDTATYTWPIPYQQLLSDPNAYPGAMLVYADIPTKGLPAVDAQAYGQFLSFTAGAGQTPGTGNGQLAVGYLPINGPNGLGQLATYTAAAAADVTAQNGLVPSLDGANPPPRQPGGGGPAGPGGDNPGAGNGGSAGPSGSAGAGDGPGGAGNGGPPSASTPAGNRPAASPTAPPGSRVGPAAVTKTIGIKNQLANAVLIILLALALVGPIAAPATILAVRYRRRRR
jgi:hypothetical protein